MLEKNPEERLNINEVFGELTLIKVNNGEILNNQYQLIKQLGEGACGTVFLAEDKESNNEL